jgi:hypothetical protein
MRAGNAPKKDAEAASAAPPRPVQKDSTPQPK